MPLPTETPPVGELSPRPEIDSPESTAQDNELFRAGFDHAAVGMAHLSPSGMFLRVNGRLCEMTGYAPDELLRMHFRAITLASDFSPADESRRARIARDGGAYTVERRYVRKNGSVFWVHIATTMLRGADGAPAKYGMSVIEDITERKRTELRLLCQNRLHGVVRKVSEAAVEAQDRQQLFELACRIVVEHGALPAAWIVELGDGAAAHTIASHRADAAGPPIAVIEGLLGANDAIARAIRAGRADVHADLDHDAPPVLPVSAASRHRIGAIACFPLHVAGKAFGALVVAASEGDYFQDGEVELLTTLANCLDLAAESLEAEQLRLRSDEQVKRQESLLASAERIAGIGRWESDLITGRSVWSDEVLRILGIDRADFDGTNQALIDRIHPDDRDAIRARLADRSSATFEFEYQIVRPDGEERVLLNRGSASFDEHGLATRRAGVVIDITERRRDELRQRRQAERLAALVQAQRKLAHSDATLEQLIALIPELALGVISADGAVFELVDGDSMLCKAVLPLHLADAVGQRFPIAESLSGEAIQQGRSLRCDDTETDSRVSLAMCRKFKLRSVLVTVVRDTDGPIGVLKMFGFAPARFGPSESDTLEILAETLGAVIQRKRAYEVARRSLDIQAGIVAVQQEMTSSRGDLQSMMDLMTTRAHELTAANGAAIIMVEGDQMIHRAASGTAIGNLGFRFRLAGSLVGLAVETDELLRSDDTRTDPRINSGVAKRFGARSMMVAPLRVGNAVVGALNVVSDKAGAFTQREAGTVQILAQWMSAVMERGGAAQQLRLSEAQYRLVFAANPLPMWVFDTDTLRFLAVNDAAIASYGYTEAEFLSMTIRDVRPAQYVRHVDEFMAQGGDRARQIGGIWKHRKKDGSIVDVEVSSNAIRFGERPARLVLAHDITERRHAERQLQKNKAIMAIAGRVAQVAGWSFDLGKRTFDYSDELCALHELPAGSVVSLKQALAYYAPESQAAMREAVNACARDGTPYDLELELITAQGRRIGVRTIGQPVRDRAGTIVGTQGAVQDISEKKQAAAQMHALAARLTTTLDSITDAFYTLDTQWRFTSVNAEAERLLRHSSADLIGRAVWEVFPQMVGGDTDRQFREAVEQKSAVDFETFFPIQRLWIEMHAYPSEAGLTVYGRDVTERHREQEQLRLLETCVAHMNDVVIISEAGAYKDQARIVFVNDAFVRFTGYSRSEALGQSPRLLQGPLTQPAELERMREALRSGHPARGELIYYRKDGSTYWVEVEGVAIRSAKGDITHWVIVQRDMTERRRAEEELRALNESLESRVTERTAALELARQDAEQASRAKSAFVATMSHEIRTPMNGVIGMIDVLEQTDLAADQSRMLDLARDSAYSLMAIIEDILDFSKIEAGKVELEREPISVAAIVSKVCELLGGATGGESVDLVTRIDPALPPAIWGDALRLRQVLINLVSNAIKFSSGGSIARVSVDATATTGPTGASVLELIIGDNGIGMDEATVSRLFKPFSQADASTTRRFGGTGLGLTISKHLIELMGGEISVKSTPDVGSTFTVRLPIALAHADAGSLALQPRYSGTARRMGGGAPHAGLILVAEDNVVNQQVITAQLKLLGFKAEVVANGREALARWRSGRFAVLLTDLQMPEMDGYDLTANIRREEAGGARTPIVALTANALKGEADRCKAAGMDDYMTKPVQLAKLEGVLEFHLGIRDSAPASTQEAPRDPSGTGPVDPAVLIALVGDDPSVVREFMLDFARSASDAATALGRAVARTDRREAGAIAHKLKSSARAIGALRLGELCAGIETAALAANDTALLAEWPSFEAEAARVCRWIAEQHGE